jgi:flavin reductase (DIM6/NTAB) family NADH-FMN oxidoreductase RutF
VGRERAAAAGHDLRVFFATDGSDGSQRNGGLPWDPFKALVAPRPIGWITTLSQDGVVNLAPYSFFNAVGERPGIVMFSSSSRKDSQTNAEATGEFVCNLATWETREQMNLTSAEVDASEPELAGLELAPSRLVAPPRVAAAPAALECVYLDTYAIRTRNGRDHASHAVFGEVVGVYVDDRFVTDEGRVDTAAMRPVARMGYDEYAAVEHAFRMARPGAGVRR